MQRCHTSRAVFRRLASRGDVHAVSLDLHIGPSIYLPVLIYIKSCTFILCVEGQRNARLALSPKLVAILIGLLLFVSCFLFFNVIGSDGGVLERAGYQQRAGRLYLHVR